MVDLQFTNMDFTELKPISGEGIPQQNPTLPFSEKAPRCDDAL